VTPKIGLAIALVAAPIWAAAPGPGRQDLTADLDAIFNVPALSRALVGVRIESLRTGETLYRRNSDKLVVPASNMKLLTLAVAAERLGWTHRFRTRLEAAGAVLDGTLTGDLIVVGTGDPSIGSPDLGHPALFLAWADALREAGIRRVDGRVIGDDNAFDDQGLGAGWAWDNIDAAYSAPSGALSYNQNVVALRVTPGRSEGDPATIELAPPGSQLRLDHDVRTGPAGSQAVVTVSRLPGAKRLSVSGRVPAGGAPVARVTTIRNPTLYFVEALRLALAHRGLRITGGAWDIDDLAGPIAAGERRVIARRESAPLSSLGADFLKASQNFYGEMLLKAIGRAAGKEGSAESGRQAARDTLAAWGITADSFVMRDGSGLSRYDYVTADAIVALLKHVWHDERLRGPFVAALPVGAHDGTLANRMKNTALARRVQAKTGTIANMRALSGFLETNSGERIVFSIIANHFTASNSEIDDVAEKVLLRLVNR
jgi:D-alanyl-D-alanine carboxypeptidase/D-alanyl-D-alanine-endopeptidase (penicillin-binding protein 4)